THGDGDHRPGATLTAGSQTVLPTVRFSPATSVSFTAAANNQPSSLGVVLYEMVTGRKPFDGGSTAAVVASILETQPASISTVQALAPPALDHGGTTCLAKDRDERWQSAGDVARQLRWIAESGEQASSGVASPALRWNRRSALAAVVCLLAGG